MERVQLSRSVLGLIVTVALAYVYGAGADHWDDAAGDSFGTLLATPIVLIASGQADGASLIVLGFILYAPAPLRPVLRSRLGSRVKSVVWYVLTLVVIGGTVVALGSRSVQEHLHGWQAIVVAVFGLGVIIRGLLFFLFASLYSAKTVFSTAQVHPMLPPVLICGVVWVIAVFNLVADGMPDAPLLVQLCSLLAGPLSVTAVSLWAIRRMRTLHMVTLRR